jgi:hypothetical protein
MLPPEITVALTVFAAILSFVSAAINLVKGIAMPPMTIFLKNPDLAYGTSVLARSRWFL